MRLSFRNWFAPRGGKLIALLLGDLLLIVLSYALAHALYAAIKQPFLFQQHLTPEAVAQVAQAFGGATPAQIRADHVRTFAFTVPLLVLLRFIFFGHFGLYRSGWRYAGLRDIINIVKATTLSSGLFFVIFSLTSKRLDIAFAPTIPVFDWAILTTLIVLTRFSLRIKKELLSWRRAGGVNVLIVGAGDAGVMLLREIVNNPGLDYYPRGFVDDDPEKAGLVIQGVPVVGARAALPHLIPTLFIREVLIAIPSASGRAIREIIETCNTLGVKFKTLPSVTEIVDGTVRIADLHDVDVMDILRREPVRLDTARIRGKIEGQTILVTGGGGSIGSELCRQIAHFNPKELVLVELSEYNLFQTSNELRRRHPGLAVRPYIADIKNEARLDLIFGQHAPALVFHAAAYKHVPIMEQNPVEAVLNNIKGTLNVVQAADKAGCSEFVMISTDKAVRPTSIMGATKRVAEKIVQCYNTISRTNFVSVRFGNVLDSSGSVLPTFKEQIMHGGPVTVTHPEITRYFMLIPEAAQLVLEAATMGDGGEIFILDMGEPVRILDLARNLIRLMGKQPDQDIRIAFTGLRPAEKLHEELVYDGTEQRTRIQKIFVTRAPAADWETLQEQVSDLIAVATVNNVPRIYECLREIVPEYQRSATADELYNAADVSVITTA